MRVDFYVLGAVPAERIVPALAARVMGEGGRLLIVAEDEALRRSLSDALWRQDGFLAHGEDAAERQPILLSGRADPANQAEMACFADGVWRETDAFARIFYLFDDTAREQARNVWRILSERDDVDAFFWKQEEGKWRQGP